MSAMDLLRAMVRGYLAESGETQERFARRAGVTLGTLSRLLRGQTRRCHPLTRQAIERAVRSAR